MTDNLEYAVGTGNAAILLTLGKAVAMLNDLETQARLARTTFEMVPGARKSPSMVRQETKDLLNARASVNMLNKVRLRPCCGCVGQAGWIDWAFYQYVFGYRHWIMRTLQMRTASTTGTGAPIVRPL